MVFHFVLDNYKEYYRSHRPKQGETTGLIRGGGGGVFIYSYTNIFKKMINF